MFLSGERIKVKSKEELAEIYGVKEGQPIEKECYFCGEMYNLCGELGFISNLIDDDWFYVNKENENYTATYPTFDNFKRNFGGYCFSPGFVDFIPDDDEAELAKYRFKETVSKDFIDALKTANSAERYTFNTFYFKDSMLKGIYNEEKFYSLPLIIFKSGKDILDFVEDYLDPIRTND